MAQDPFSCKFLGSYNSISSKLDTWKEELINDKDSTFLLDGITNGFHITELDSDIVHVKEKNHFSATVPETKKKVEKELVAQIQQGNYVVAKTQPAIVSPLAAIPKDGSDEVRLIHDGSRPAGAAMNDYTGHHSVRYQTISDACRIAKPGYYLAKLDLKSAYRSVPVHPKCYKATGLAWNFGNDKEETFLFDTRLPFGSKCGPSHFTRITQSICRMMAKRGFDENLCYIDDFFLAFDSFEKCNEALLCLLNLVRSLGFNVSWKKVVSPSQHVQFLGIDFDTRDCTLSLDEIKLSQLHEKLSRFRNRKRASLKQLQSLAGSLNWAIQVVRGGRFFLRRILDTMNTLKHMKHKAILGREFKLDLDWWLTYMSIFNGTIYYRKESEEHIHVDACQSAAGMFYSGDWHYVNFRIDWPAIVPLHINYKEACSITKAVDKWAPMLANRLVTVHTDSASAKAMINKGRTKDPFVNALLRKLWWQSARYNFDVRAIHIPGKVHCMADTISRIHEPGNTAFLSQLLSRWHHGRTASLDIGAHMSVKAFRYLQVHAHLRQNWS